MSFHEQRARLNRSSARIVSALLGGVLIFVCAATFADTPSKTRPPHCLPVPGNTCAGLATVKSLSVVDADGKTIGQLEGANRVLLAVGERLFYVGIDKTGFQEETGGFILFFESEDCTGTSFVDYYTRHWFVDQARISGPGKTVYLPDADDLRENFQSNSQTDSVDVNTCYSFKNTVRYAAPEIPVIDLDTIFTPPFEVKAKVKKVKY